MQDRIGEQEQGRKRPAPRGGRNACGPHEGAGARDAQAQEATAAEAARLGRYGAKQEVSSSTERRVSFRSRQNFSDECRVLRFYF